MSRVTSKVWIAVNTGEALVSVDARPATGEAMVAGDVVNTAARLQAAAPVNGVLVGEATYRVTERAIEYRTADDDGGLADFERQGRRADADADLERSLAFWRSVGAGHYLRAGSALLAEAS